jgi:hypothetical protein
MLTRRYIKRTSAPSKMNVSRNEKARRRRLRGEMISGLLVPDSIRRQELSIVKKGTNSPRETGSRFRLHIYISRSRLKSSTYWKGFVVWLVFFLKKGTKKQGEGEILQRAALTTWVEKSFNVSIDRSIYLNIQEEEEVLSFVLYCPHCSPLRLFIFIFSWWLLSDLSVTTSWAAHLIECNQHSKSNKVDDYILYTRSLVASCSSFFFRLSGFYGPLILDANRVGLVYDLRAINGNRSLTL